LRQCRSPWHNEELDYSEMLDWFGLRFVKPDGDAGRWALEVRDAATPAQREHLDGWLRPSAPR
jgi:hypothetical protein